ncbi:hypothetical protein FDP41_012957 [Naegleria fowleri]|uniref:Uncharacterized protein n=1 Tax=Naegleria fowleri TaxID=5763 RepID=A0A6A5C7A8_NAEFO|nr:uncharacterized protein FDP41_012957 [Naegleria fowleri]KAF0981169.1 hypothetical protein FDP41_012957 [Naegleria fowleri]
MNIIPLLEFHASPTGNALANIESPTGAGFNTPQSDVKLLTIKSLDSQHIIYLAGIVQARSVKLVTTETMKLSDMQKERDSWWNELRTEIRENAKSLGCSHVIGYSESYEIFIRGSVCILCAQGTAAILNPQYDICNIRNLSDDLHEENISEKVSEEKYCSIFHLPRNSPFYRAGASKCPLHADGYVPNLFLSTCEMPSIVEQRVLNQPKHYIEARICRSKKKEFGESNATVVSNILPFAVHDLHKQFMNKMKLCNCNSAFCVTYGLTINDNFIVLTCKGTGVYLDALPRNAKMDFILPDEKDNTEQLKLLKEYSDYYSAELDASIVEEPHLIRELQDEERQVDSPRFKDTLDNSSYTSSDNEDVIGEMGSAGFALELEDEQDEDFINSILEPLSPNGIHFTTLKHQSDIASKHMSHLQFIFLEKSFPLSKTTHNVKQQQQYIASLFRELYITLSFKLLLFANQELNQRVYVMGMSEKIRFNNANDFTITLQAMPVLVSSKPSTLSHLDQLKSNLPKLFPSFPYPHDIGGSSDQLSNSPRKEDTITSSEELKNIRDIVIAQENDIDKEWLEESYVVTSPMYFIPGAKIEKLVGKINHHLVRESNNVMDFASFQQECIMEATSIVRAHTRAIDCNALLNYCVKFHAVLDNPSKKQAYIMLTVSGDACRVSYSPNSSAGIHRLIELSCSK